MLLRDPLARLGAGAASSRRACLNVSRIPQCSRLVPHVCRAAAKDDRNKPVPQQPRSQQQPQAEPQPPLHSRLLAGCSAAVAALLVPLLPSWAFDTFDSLTDSSYVDPSLGEAPPLMDALLVVVITYFTVMLLYIWLSSFMADGDGSKGGSSNSQSPSDQSDMPPGYGTFLDAHVRTYVNPSSHKVSALQDLGQAQPLEGEDLEHLKNRLAAGAVEALELQCRDCDRLVRSKLLARKLGYRPNRPANGTSTSSSGHHSPSSSSSLSPTSSLPGAAAHHLPTDEDIGALMTAAVLTAPGGLVSWQQRAALEALIDKELEDLLPPGGGAYQEDLIVRQVMRRVVQHLVMEESLLLLEGTEQAKRTLEASGQGHKANQNWWALW